MDKLPRIECLSRVAGWNAAGPGEKGAGAEMFDVSPHYVAPASLIAFRILVELKLK